MAVNRVGRSRQGTTAERRAVHPLAGILQAPVVAYQHENIGKQMLRQDNRLCALKMGISGHDRAGMGFCLCVQRLNQRIILRADFCNAVSQGHAQVQRNLVIPAARRMQPFACIADAGGQHAFNKHMDVLGCRVDLQRAVL